jgi:hypothetical protein
MRPRRIIFTVRFAAQTAASSGELLAAFSIRDKSYGDSCHA